MNYNYVKRNMNRSNHANEVSLAQEKTNALTAKYDAMHPDMRYSITEYPGGNPHGA